MNKDYTKKKNLNKKPKDLKGNWEFNFFQKIVIPNEEEKIKITLVPSNVFNPKKIHDYINPQLSREEIIEQNVLDNKKITKVEQIIYDNYIKNRKEKIEKDLNDFKLNGVKAKPETKEGKIQLLMMVLEIKIKKKQYEDVASIYFKLKDYDNYYIKYKDLVDKMNSIVCNLNLIELQFTKFYSQMPPLNKKGFTKFDDWQIEAINNIDNNISTIISAPTSAGKTVISGYTITKGRVLYIIPSDPLAWQLSAYIEVIINSKIPIITQTYQSEPNRDKFIQILNSSIGIVGTADSILSYLPFINCDFSWIVFDEIHMIGDHEGFAMEIIAKFFSDIPFLALSATISNLIELKDWFQILNNNRKVQTIECNKRFFNLQKYYYKDNDIKMMHPLSLIDDIDETLLTKTFNPTPLDTWDLVTKIINSEIDLGDLHYDKYFEKFEQIELNKANRYFYDLINFIVFNKDNKKIQNIVNSYKHNIIDNENNIENLLDLIMILKKNDKCPAIIFQKNTIACINIVKNLSNYIDIIEEQKYPELRNKRCKDITKTKQLIKKQDKENKDLTEKQEFKKMLESKNEEINIQIESVNAPHNDFIFNGESKFTDGQIEEYHEKFKNYFPNMNCDFHYLIRLLWRGIGVYLKGLPDPYLRLIQSLASNKKLAIVFSDISLVFGISMPFRTSVIYHDNNCIDNLNPMIYHQMAGRAGRRGLDKEGNIIFIGYSWNRIKELSISSIPIVVGTKNIPLTFLHAQLFSKNNNWSNVVKNFLSKNINIDNKIIYNFETIWNDTLKDDINTTQLMWNFRYSIEGVIVLFIFPYIKKYFDNANPSNENDQVEIAYFLSKFIHITTPYDINNNLTNTTGTYKINYEIIYKNLQEQNINISEFIDNKIWQSIKKNVLIENNNEILREKLFDFSIKIKIIQHYCFHNKYVNLTRLLGKLLTRIWWIYHGSSTV